MRDAAAHVAKDDVARAGCEALRAVGGRAGRRVLGHQAGKRCETKAVRGAGEEVAAVHREMEWLVGGWISLEVLHRKAAEGLLGSLVFRRIACFFEGVPDQ